ncbi:hypothetical protein HIM_09442 [Hirsutella minnesotensis 3608]|uniref:Uncharacterized protein n=1 Tax=Hirsutella minnesotensis 3608 TaxID=1043627 RepID=A0A0F7ZXR6_9HYPO|nr:hypothetical protein HIM_09442 [Hirsutella minnesotensis 3608]
MASLSAHDHDIIACYPLGNSLDHLRKSLQDAERSYSSIFDSHDGANDSEQHHQDIISHLLTTLMGRRVAFCLLSKSSGRDVASDLGLLLTRIRKGDLKYSYYRHLVRLVIQKASDFDVWSAVLDLITKLTRATPPTSAPATFNVTLTTYSFPWQQGSEQTWRKAKPRVYEEIRRCTHRRGGGSHEKYFKDKWNERAKQIWQAITSRYSGSDEGWTQLSNVAAKDAVCDRCLSLQQELLAKERTAYFRNIFRNMNSAF